MDKTKKIKYLHIAIIILGSIFISLSIFHTNMWFDESYTVALVKHSFAEIWQIGGTDVHPILYYFCLHALNLIFGNNIIVYRIFSAMCMVLLSLLGYTHIRKDFGEKTGFLFSFFSLFLPFSAMYAGEMRMYSLGILLGTIMVIYAYRIYKNDIHKTTFIFFGLSSLLVSYTHYYGLMFAGVVNLILFVYLCKNVKKRKSDLFKFIITAVLQVVAYIPWLVCFIRQLKGVSEGFWISLSFPETIYDLLTVQYRGNLSFTPVFLCTALYSYLIYLISKTNKKDRKPAMWGLGIYIFIILVAWVISLSMFSVILLDRYLIILTGLIIFALSFFIARDNKAWRAIIVCIVILVISGISNIALVKENYNEKNLDCVSYLNSQFKEGDIIVYSAALNGAAVTTELSNEQTFKSYFYNKDNWRIDDEYKAFSPYMEITRNIEEVLENYHGRIWVIENGNTFDLKNEIASKYKVKEL